MALCDLIAHYWKPIASLLATDGVNDICIDRFDRIYYTKDGAKFDSDATWSSEAEFRAAANLLVTNVNGVPLTDEHPVADARFEDGSRLSVHIPPLTACTVAAIRVMRPRLFTMEELTGTMFPAAMLPWLRRMISGPHALLISGIPGSGKTALLRALLSEVCQSDRLFVIEDTAELQLPLRFGVAHEVSAGNKAKLTLADSIRSSLRFAPDGIVVGELRSEQAMLAYIEAHEAGFRVCGTLHANSAVGAMPRMVSRLARLGLFNSMEPYEYLVYRNVSGVVHCARDPKDGRPRVVEVCELRDGRPYVLWAYDGSAGEWLQDERAQVAA